MENDNGGEQQNESGGAQLIRLSKKDRESYQFSKYNIYITGVSLKIEDAFTCRCGCRIRGNGE